MPIIQIAVVLIVVGMLLFAANRFLPMDDKIRQILNAVVVILVVLWLLSLFVPGLWNIRVSTVR